MHIVRKWPIARAEHIDNDGVSWLAESRAGTGTWVIRNDETDAAADVPNGGLAVRGMMVKFSDEQEGVLLPVTQEQQDFLGMSRETLVELEVQLRRSYENRKACRCG